MKKLVLELNKRLLIVEVENCDVTIDKEGIHFYFLNGGKDFIKGNYHSICKSSELTEDVAKGLVGIGSYANTFKNYITNDSHKSNQKQTSLESFISAIEAKGHYWGENPYGEEPQDISDLGEFTVMMRKKHQAWQEAESRTFHLEKTLIFEIV